MRKRYYEGKMRRKAILYILGRVLFLLFVLYLTANVPQSIKNGALSAAEALAKEKTLQEIILLTGFSKSFDIDFDETLPISFCFPEFFRTKTDTDTPSPPKKEETQKPKDDTSSYAKPNGNIISVTMTGKGSSSYQNGGGVYYKNKTDYQIDMDSIISGSADIKVSGSSPQVLIIHTHGSEAYEPEEGNTYIPSDPSRTQDKEHNMVRVGEEFCSVLEKNGISFIHDTALYDYPSYTGSYNRSMEAIDKYLEKYPSIKIVLDLHRDALEGDGKTYKVSASLPSKAPCAQVMLVIGTDYNGLSHPNWKENLAFAAKLQKAADKKYETLMRPMVISGSRYNQQATSGSLIVEIGTNGNTLNEALCAARLFADVFCDTVL